jgi:hypothetical protein
VAARRLVIVMLVLLGLSTLAAALIDPPETTEDEEVATEPAPGPPPRGELVRRRIRAEGRSPATIAVEVGDQLALTVTSRRGEEIEIPALGELRFASPLDPAGFDLLVREEGTYGVRLVEANRMIATIEVSARDHRRTEEREGRMSRAAPGTSTREERFEEDPG